MSELRPLVPAPPLMHHFGKRLRRAASAADRLSLPSRDLFQLQEMHACCKSQDTVRALLVHVQVTSCSCSVTYCCCASLQCRFAAARQTVFDAVRNKAQDECSKPVRKVAGKR